MWNQLAKIRVLQSEIARMHVSMEREEFESATKLKSTEKEGGEEEGGSKMGNSQKSNAYTAKMKDEFEARKESIEAVMSKVLPSLSPSFEIAAAYDTGWLRSTLSRN
jgi:hypothetical protein